MATSLNQVKRKAKKKKKTEKSNESLIIFNFFFRLLNVFFLQLVNFLSYWQYIETSEKFPVLPGT